MSPGEFPDSAAGLRPSYEFGPFRLDLAGRVLLKEGKPVPLTPKVVDLLIVMVENAGRVVDKDHLMKLVWPDTFVEETNLTTNISILRKALGQGSGGAGYIETISKRGYRFTAAITVVPPVPGQQAAAEGARSSLELVGSYADSAPVSRMSRRHRLMLMLGVTLAALAAVLAYLALRTVRQSKAVPVFTQLTDTPGEELYPSLSPDGRFIAFASRASGTWDIFLQRVGSRNPVNVTRDSKSDDTQPTFSTDGERIAFRSNREGGGIFVMTTTGESVRKVASFGFNPAWSPDGKEIAFATADVRSATERDGALNSQIFAVDVHTGRMRLLSRGVNDAVQPHWSPHGYRIAFWGLRKGGWRDIFTVVASPGVDSGTPLVAITEDEWLDWNPVWSPDGRCVYFSSNRTGVMTLWQVPIEERSGKTLGTPEVVTAPSAYSGQVSVAADGARLAYVHWTITMNLESIAFDPARGTVTGAPAAITKGSRQIHQPSLSPDGTWLVFASHTPQEDIWVMRTDGTGARELTNDRYYDRLPRWSPDGGRIAFYSNRAGQWDIWSISPQGTGLEQLTFTETGKVLWPVWSPDGKRLSCSNMGASPFIINTKETWGEQTPDYLPSPPVAHGFFLATSWSPDGSNLAGFLSKVDGTGSLGAIVYSVRTRRYQQLTDWGGNVQWLADGRRVFIMHEGVLHLLDTETGSTSKVLALAPDRIHPPTAVAKDDRTIFFIREEREADLWMLTNLRF